MLQVGLLRELFRVLKPSARLLASAGFALINVTDTSEQAAQIAQRWHAARERRHEPLLALEGQDRYEGLQRFLSCVHQVTAGRRLLRHLYLAEKLLTH